MAHPSKVKGNTYEREIVEKFKKENIECKRAWGSNGQALGMHEEVDCLANNELRIQAKRRKKIAKWLKPSIFVDAVVVREDRGENYIILRLDDFLEDYKNLIELKKIAGNDVVELLIKKSLKSNNKEG
mgnify:CR=1 FL=1|tara:strand:- start:124 stop:507 length:384 start_codon:yes stop_codon:yes gene_type:complete